MATFLQDRNWLDPAKCCMAGEDGRIQSGKMGRKFSLNTKYRAWVNSEIVRSIFRAIWVFLLVR